MKVIVRARHLDVSDTLLFDIARRVERAFARVAESIRAIECVVTDINGPRGGADKHVRLRIRGSRLSLVVEDLGVDIHATVASACVRAERAVLRQLSRRRGFVPFSVN